MSQVYDPNSKFPSHMKMPQIGIDFDEVLAQTTKAFIEDFNQRHGTSFKLKDATLWDLAAALGSTQEEVIEIFRTDGFFENLDAKPNSISALNKLIKSRRYDLFIVTATTEDPKGIHLELGQKINWLKRHIPNFQPSRIIALGNSTKALLRLDAMIDDKPENLRDFVPYGTYPILVDSPTNKYIDEFKRIYSLKELPDILDAKFYPDEIKKSS